MNYTAKEAKEKKVYYLEMCNEVYEQTFMVYKKKGNKIVSKWYIEHAHNKLDKSNTDSLDAFPKLISCNYRIVESSLFDFIMQSIEFIITPRGLEPKLHIRIGNDKLFRYEVWTWGKDGHNPEMLMKSTSLEDAEDYIFKLTYENDFLNDTYRDTVYFENKEDAEIEAINRSAWIWNFDRDIVAAIWRNKTAIE